jgi:Escherichia/Staphylococcus phage prohead protease
VIKGKKEVRFIAQDVRASGDSKKRKLTGHSAVFGQRAQIGSFLETIQPGAFKQVLSQPDLDCVFLVNHNPDFLLGRTPDTLRLWEDEVGLAFECELPDTTLAGDVLEQVRVRNLRSCSFGFIVGEGGDTWQKLADGTMLRTITSVEALLDSSVVNSPAYQGTDIGARSRALFPDGMEHVEARMAQLRDAGADNHGEPVPFVNLGKDKRSEDPFDSVDAANGIISWADGEDARSVDAPVKNKLKAAQGFAFVKGNGDVRSDYLLPHHLVRSGELVHSQMGCLRAMMSFKTGSVEIPVEHRSAVENHLQQELSYWFPPADADVDEDERMKLRLEFLKAL